MINVIKRNKTQVEFNKSKIIAAINKAKQDTPDSNIKESQITDIADYIEFKCNKMDHAVDIEEIQDMVENGLMGIGQYQLARNYVRYRYNRELNRGRSSLDDRILSLVDNKNEEVMQENSNKNPTINSTQRDYIAGEVSKDMCRRLIFSKDVMEAHDKGIIHVHDMDYSIQHSLNCALVNLEDMLQNGTVISGVTIEKPKSLRTAATIMTQIMAQVASVQYGGQSMSIGHIAPFVDISRKKIKEQVKEELKGVDISSRKINNIVETRLKREIKDAVQTIQYQILTLNSSNGQSPFVSLYLSLSDAKNKREEKDTAMLIEEILNQRIAGIKNEVGVPITIQFPKLLYVLDENNINPESEYYWLTELAAKCTAKRMVPDYISAKKSREYKEGNVFACMGCLDGDEVITYKLNNELFVESFERAWNRIQQFYIPSVYSNTTMYINTPGLYIYDSFANGFVEVKRFIRNNDMGRWYRVNFNNRTIIATADHPLPTARGRVSVENLQIGDIIPAANKQYNEVKSTCNISLDMAWLLGIIICDGSYRCNQVTISVGIDEYELATRIVSISNKVLNASASIIERNRGSKGHYFDIKIRNVGEFVNYLETIFGGVNKANRHIPNIVFSDFNTEAKISFMGGMIDGDGYIRRTTLNSYGKSIDNKMYIGSTNKELAIQQAMLGSILGLNPTIHNNWYKGKQFQNNIRYVVGLEMSMAFSDNEILTCNKKRIYNKNFIIGNATNTSVVKSIKFLGFRNKYEYDVETVSDHFDVSGINSHNCRSFLNPWKDKNGKYKFWGRSNLGVVTINLPYIALLSKKNKTVFWKEFDKYLELCYKAHMNRYSRLKNMVSDYAPIMWQHGGLARLKPGEKVTKYLEGGYCSISLGYAGLYECVKYMTGKSHISDKIGKAFGIKIMEYLNHKCNEWKNRSNLAFSVYGTPIENTTYKFGKALQKSFGKIKDISDHNYITNSFHTVVREEIDAFTKLSIEGEYQKYSLGGVISYVECPNMEDNIPAVLALLKHIYENTLYAELNIKSDYCQKCGWEKEIPIVEEKGKLIFKCPNCGNSNRRTLNIARRVCGYISTNEFNQGRTQEIKERVLHL